MTLRTRRRTTGCQGGKVSTTYFVVAQTREKLARDCESMHEKFARENANGEKAPPCCNLRKVGLFRTLPRGVKKSAFWNRCSDQSIPPSTSPEGRTLILPCVLRRFVTVVGLDFDTAGRGCSQNTLKDLSNAQVGYFSDER